MIAQQRKNYYALLDDLIRLLFYTQSVALESSCLILFAASFLWMRYSKEDYLERSENTLTVDRNMLLTLIAIYTLHNVFVYRYSLKMRKEEKTGLKLENHNNFRKLRFYLNNKRLEEMRYFEYQIIFQYLRKILIAISVVLID